MSGLQYRWRNLTPAEREELLAWRRSQSRPWHSPPHLPNLGNLHYLLTAACYEHQPHIGRSPERMDGFACALTGLLTERCVSVLAWCVLPNHYHALVESADVRLLARALGALHGRTSHAWNGEEGTRGRRVFYRAMDRAMRSEAHLLATVNYVHHNPVRHGYADRWSEWPWSSAAEYLERAGEAEAARVWRAYPVRDYGTGWDDAGI